jgi:hypothetical protein
MSLKALQQRFASKDEIYFNCGSARTAQAVISQLSSR